MSRLTRRDLRWLLPVLLLGGWLRLHELGRPSFWLDEAYTWYLTLPDWRDVWNAMLAISDVSPLPYVLTRLAVPFLGRSEFALRFAAAAPGLLAVPVVYRLGRALFSRRAGLLAALLLALSPFAVWYARDARPYGLYLLLAALALWGFWRWAQAGRGPGMMVIASAGLFVTHYGAALLALAQAAYLIQRLRSQPLLFRRWFAWQAAAVAPAAAYGLAFLLRRQPVTANTWIPRPGWLAPLHTLLNYLTGDAERLSLAGWALVAGALAFIALALRAGNGVDRHARAGRLLLWWLGLPPLAIWLLSFRLPAYVDRFFLPGLVALVLLLARGLERLSDWPAAQPWARRGAWLAGLALAVLMLASSSRLYAAPLFAREDWRGAAQFIAGRDAGAPLLAQDAESLLGLLPYYQPPETAAQAAPETLAALTTPAVIVLRSPHESSHRLSKSAPFDPLTESPLAGWFAAHPERVLRVERLSGVAVVVVGP